VAFRGVVSGSRGEIFQQSKNKWYRSPEKAKGDKRVRDTVTTKKNKMGAACKTSVVLRAGAGKGQEQGQDGVFESDGTRIQRRGRMMSMAVFQDEDVIRELYLHPVAQGVERRSSASGK
jgi:hypothetical protein